MLFFAAAFVIIITVCNESTAYDGNSSGQPSKFIWGTKGQAVSKSVANPDGLANIVGAPRSRRSAPSYPENLLVKSRPIDKKQSVWLTKEHNDYRSKIPSSNMQYMFWSHRLAASAQRHADRCDFRHSRDRTDVGENIWAAPYADFSEAVRLWFVEVHDKSCACPHAYKHCCGHYTQIPSSNMQYMFWSHRLAASAQRHADRCDFRHSRDRTDVGENIWAAPYADFSEAVRLWFVEVHDKSCACPHAYKHCCGHYTQIPSSNMQYMFWSHRLAASAQRHADRCDFRHSRDRTDVGENIWAAPYADFSEAVRLWFVEVHDKSCACPHAYKHCCGHYTQIPSSNMQYMFWSHRLAASAQRHADRCDFRHSRDRTDVGENIWAAPNADFSEAVRLWFVEVNDKSCGCPHAYKHCCGHYTQVVWASSNQFGCGFAQCSDIWGVRGGGHRNILVCHYAPQGNVIRRIRGKLYPVAAFRWTNATHGACSECPSRMRKCYQGLCY